jgi:hypothetical protein
VKVRVVVVVVKDHYTNSHTDCMIEYEVEKIMAHRNKKGKPMEYHIEWLGYEDPADDSWEPGGGSTRDGTVDNMHLNQYNLTRKQLAIIETQPTRTSMTCSKVHTRTWMI